MPMMLMRSAKRRFRDWWRGETDATYFDIHNLRTLNAVLEAHGVAPLTRKPSRHEFGHCERVKRIFEFRADLRREFPYALTPRGRGEYLHWLLAHGRSDLGLTAEEIVRFLFEMDAEQTRGIAATFRVTPDWQRRVPDGLTTQWPELLTWLATEHGFAGRWFRRLANLAPSHHQTGGRE